MKEKVNQLSQEDILLFRTMAEHYQSENERIFFETMKYKEEYELAFMNDLLLTEDDNEDKLFFIRIYADEYEVGLGSAKKHFQSLADALNMSLSEIADNKQYEILFWETFKIFLKKKLSKNLLNSNKSSTFAADFEMMRNFNKILTSKTSRLYVIVYTLMIV